MLKNRIEMYGVIVDRTHFSSRASSASAESFQESRAKFGREMCSETKAGKDKYLLSRRICSYRN